MIMLYAEIYYIISFETMAIFYGELQKYYTVNL